MTKSSLGPLKGLLQVMDSTRILSLICLSVDVNIRMLRQSREGVQL